MPPVGDARVRAHGEQQARVLDVRVEPALGSRVEHPVVDQEVLGLLLGEGVEPPRRAERHQEGERVIAVHVVGLAAHPGEGHAARRVLEGDRAELLGDLADRRVPVDALEAAVGPAPQRVLRALIVVRVVPHAEGLVAEVAVGDRVRVVRADLVDLAALHVDAQAAVVAAQHTHGREVLGVERDRGLRDGRIDGGRSHAFSSSASSRKVR